MALNKTKLTLALSSAIAASLSFPATASEDSNPFAAQALSKGYMVAANEVAPASKDGAKKEVSKKKKRSRDCAEMKKNLKEDKSADAKCGANMAKEMEGKCGAMGSCGNMMKPAEKKVEEKAEAKPKAAEAKCGTGKCGGTMK